MATVLEELQQLEVADANRAGGSRATDVAGEVPEQTVPLQGGFALKDGSDADAVLDLSDGSLDSGKLQQCGIPVDAGDRHIGDSTGILQTGPRHHQRDSNAPFVQLPLGTLQRCCELVGTTVV